MTTKHLTPTICGEGFSGIGCSIPLLHFWLLVALLCG